MERKTLAQAVAATAAALFLLGCAGTQGAMSRTVAVRSDPPGATVLVDGKQLGTTPTEIAVFPCSNYRLMLEKSGFQAASIEVGPATVPVSAMVMPWYVALPPIGFPAYCALSAFTPNVVTASLKLAAGPPAPAK
jgi:hypothetical protein